jgi:hypothetical protein
MEYSAAEGRRCAIFEIEDPAPYREWLQASRPIFETMTPITRRGVMIWLDLFRSHANDEDGEIIGHGLIKRLDQTKSALLALNASVDDDDTFEAIAALTPAALRSHRVACDCGCARNKFLCDTGVLTRFDSLAAHQGARWLCRSSQPDVWPATR